ncbi:hypothetical protein D3C87_411850 [compost metagenome]
MHNYILLAGLTLAIFFFLMDKNLLPTTLLARKYMLSKLEKNKIRDKQLQEELQELINQNDAWSYLAFPDSEVTYKEYMELLEEKYSIEYADAEFESLRTKKMSRRQMHDYIEKIRSQEEAALALKADVDYQKRNLQTLSLCHV